MFSGQLCSVVTFLTYALLLIAVGKTCKILMQKHCQSSGSFTLFEALLHMVCRLESSDHIGIPLACELADSKYFPVSNSAKEVRDKILQACLKRGVKIRSV